MIVRPGTGDRDGDFVIAIALETPVVGVSDMLDHIHRMSATRHVELKEAHKSLSRSLSGRQSTAVGTCGSKHATRIRLTLKWSEEVQVNDGPAPTRPMIRYESLSNFSLLIAGRLTSPFLGDEAGPCG